MHDKIVLEEYDRRIGDLSGEESEVLWRNFSSDFYQAGSSASLDQLSDTSSDDCWSRSTPPYPTEGACFATYPDNYDTIALDDQGPLNDEHMIYPPNIYIAPLEDLVPHNNGHMVLELLDHKAGPACEANRCTRLYDAMTRGNIQLIQLLFGEDIGASPQAKNGEPKLSDMPTGAECGVWPGTEGLCGENSGILLGGVEAMNGNGWTAVNQVASGGPPGVAKGHAWLRAKASYRSNSERIMPLDRVGGGDVKRASYEAACRDESNMAKEHIWLRAEGSYQGTGHSALGEVAIMDSSSQNTLHGAAYGDRLSVGIRPRQLWCQDDDRCTALYSARHKGSKTDRCPPTILQQSREEAYERTTLNRETDEASFLGGRSVPTRGVALPPMNKLETASQTGVSSPQNLQGPPTLTGTAIGGGKGEQLVDEYDRIRVDLGGDIGCYSRLPRLGTYPTSIRGFMHHAPLKDRVSNCEQVNSRSPGAAAQSDAIPHNKSSSGPKLVTRSPTIDSTRLVLGDRDRDELEDGDDEMETSSDSDSCFCDLELPPGRIDLKNNQSYGDKEKGKGKDISRKRTAYKIFPTQEIEDRGYEDGPPSKRPKKDMRRQGKSPEHSKKPFACPYYKKNPLKYSGCAEWRNTKIRQVKEHIKAYHLKSLQCGRCKIFQAGSYEQIKQHLINENCEKSDTDTLTATEKADNLDKAKTWQEIYKILFPLHIPNQFWQDQIGVLMTPIEDSDLSFALRLRAAISSNKQEYQSGLADFLKDRLKLGEGTADELLGEYDKDWVSKTSSQASLLSDRDCDHSITVKYLPTQKHRQSYQSRDTT